MSASPIPGSDRTVKGSQPDRWLTIVVGNIARMDDENYAVRCGNRLQDRRPIPEVARARKASRPPVGGGGLE